MSPLALAIRYLSAVQVASKSLSILVILWGLPKCFPGVIILSLHFELSTLFELRPDSVQNFLEVAQVLHSWQLSDIYSGGWFRSLSSRGTKGHGYLIISSWVINCMNYYYLSTPSQSGWESSAVDRRSIARILLREALGSYRSCFSF